MRARGSRDISDPLEDCRQLLGLAALALGPLAFAAAVAILLVGAASFVPAYVPILRFAATVLVVVFADVLRPRHLWESVLALAVVQSVSTLAWTFLAVFANPFLAVAAIPSAGFTFLHWRAHGRARRVALRARDFEVRRSSLGWVVVLVPVALAIDVTRLPVTVLGPFAGGPDGPILLVHSVASLAKSVAMVLLWRDLHRPPGPTTRNLVLTVAVLQTVQTSAYLPFAVRYFLGTTGEYGAAWIDIDIALFTVTIATSLAFLVGSWWAHVAIRRATRRERPSPRLAP
ncbi:MAG: hypothetical protein R3F34_06550 [Planctomycetota bacterium]